MSGYGFTYNGVASSNYNVTATDTITGILPPLKGRTISVPNRPGAWYIRTDLGPRWIKVKVAITETSNTSLRTQIRQIAQWLSTVNGPQTLVFDNEPGLTYYAVLDAGMSTGAGTQSTDIKQLVTLGQGELTFMCVDPFAYGTQESLAFASDSASPNVTGTYETWPTIDVTFTGGATDFKVSLGRLYVLVNHIFVAGDTLTVDCSKQEIQINGVSAMADLGLSSNFFALQPGAQTLSITPTGVTTASVSWTPGSL
ncbi:distal tail protein Dit [Alicyclobacillus sp. SO9]|uniref:distal tail protein Dit n=1 Tax=Alicyclobacillus sp. SO9 TaxID=2665646 RepID=UPI0018E7B71D|nr:distal tail protein Dit [Alicyclobacillus sp. SO9]QQE80936.1 phage tail family protein [Alicyclobacillus sp. SO9]